MGSIDLTPVVYLAWVGVIALATAVPYVIYKLVVFAWNACWSCL